MHVTISTGLYVAHDDQPWRHDGHISVAGRALLTRVAASGPCVHVGPDVLPDADDGAGLADVVAELVDCGWLFPVDVDRYELVHPARLAVQAH